MQQGEAGAPDGSVYLADEQTGGRGRGAHAWHSAAGSGLYVSVLLRPRIAPADVLWFSLAAGLAVREGLKQVTSLEADLRWPNDLLFGPKKFCGILTELNAEVTRVRHLVIGIGINVHQESFPPELRDVATSLRLETGRSWPRQEILAAFLRALHARGAGSHGGSESGGAGEVAGAAGECVFVDSRQAGDGGRRRRVFRNDCRPGRTRILTGEDTRRDEDGDVGRRARNGNEGVTACC